MSRKNSPAYSGPKANNFQRIRELPAVKQKVLALSLLERMRPNYELFVHVTEFEQAHQLDNLLTRLWERAVVKGAKVSLTAIENKIEEITPDEHDFDMYGVYPAIFFCTGVLTYINGEMNQEDYDSVAIAKISQGCVTHLIEYQHDEEIDNQTIREHELMLAEMDVLSELIEWLEATSFKNLSVNDIRSAALEKAFANGVTNIGIEVE